MQIVQFSRTCPSEVQPKHISARAPFAVARLLAPDKPDLHEGLAAVYAALTRRGQQADITPVLSPYLPALVRIAALDKRVYSDALQGVVLRSSVLANLAALGENTLPPGCTRSAALNDLLAAATPEQAAQILGYMLDRLAVATVVDNSVSIMQWCTAIGYAHAHAAPELREMMEAQLAANGFSGYSRMWTGSEKADEVPYLATFMLAGGSVLALPWIHDVAGLNLHGTGVAMACLGAVLSVFAGFSFRNMLRAPYSYILRNLDGPRSEPEPAQPFREAEAGADVTR